MYGMNFSSTLTLRTSGTHAAAQHVGRFSNFADKVKCKVVNAGRLLRCLTDPQRKLDFVQYKLTRRQQQKLFDQDVTWQQLSPQQQKLFDQDVTWQQLSPQQRDKASNVAADMLGVRGIQKKGLHKVELEEHAQKVIRTMMDEGKITAEQHQALAAKWNEKHAELFETPEDKNGRLATLGLAEEKASLEAKLADFKAQGKTKAETESIIDRLEEIDEDANIYPNLQDERLELKASIGWAPETRRSLADRLTKASQTRREIEAGLEKRVTALVSKLEREPEQEAMLLKMLEVSAEMKRLNILLDKLGRKATEEMRKQREVLGKELKSMSPEDRENLAEAEALSTVKDQLAKAVLAEEIATEKLAGLDTKRERLAEIEAEMGMKTSFVDLSAHERLECFDSMDTYLECIGRIGREWMSHGLHEENMGDRFKITIDTDSPRFDHDRIDVLMTPGKLESPVFDNELIEESIGSVPDRQLDVLIAKSKFKQ